MGFRFYRSVRLGKALRLNLSKTGVGLSAGFPGARYSIHSSGRTVKTLGLPGSGLYYRKDTYAKKRSSPAQRTPRTPTAPQIQIYPHAGVFAPKEDKLFVQGMTAYMQGRHEEALAALHQVSARDPANAHVGEELIAGLSLIALERLPEAIPVLESVVASNQAIPDALMLRYGVTGSMQIAITPAVTAAIPMSHVSAALMLAELYQHTDRPQDAVKLLESLGSIAPDPIFALSAAELYSQLGRPDDVLRVTEGFTQNRDDVTAQLLVYRADALREKGVTDGALQILKEAIRFRSRNPQILRAARYARGLVYEGAGRKAQARKDWERIYAEDPSFADVATRVGSER